MYSIKEFKRNARKVLKRHYLLLVVLLLIAAMLGTSFGNMLDLVRFNRKTEAGTTVIDVIKSAAYGDFDGALDIAAGNRESLSGVSFKIGGVEFGHQKGVFSDIANAYSSGSIIASFASVIFNITKDTSVAGYIFMAFALMFIAIETIFVSQIYKVIYSRMFLECRIYDKVGIPALTHLFRVRRWRKASLSYLRYNVRLGLWWLTIAGGIVNHYKYAMVRYILAENPDICGKEAMNLSKKMMKGHKFEMFRLDLSFFGWYLLSILTGGLVLIFYAAPYIEATKAEYYHYIRKLSKLYKVEGVERLNDKYLFEVATKIEIDDAYSDVIEIMQRPEIKLPEISGVRAFFQDTLGVVVRYDRKEMQYRKDMSEKAGVAAYKSIVEGLSYPYRLSPCEAGKAKKTWEHQLYMRHYSIPSLILIFFSFCFVGWIWEVAIHIVNDGRFVNRGVLHGPWLPIYGVGAILILLCLNKFRENPKKEFVAAIVLCGAVEYFGSWFLEKLFDGQKWWDYTGYFLNINGRICAEGLLVFGLAGIAAVYFIAPILDNHIMRINRKMKNPLCTLLLVVFVVDMFFSTFVPNTGEGITDYGNDTITADL